MLINPNGILFGRTAQLNVGSLIASSLELKEYDPATGRLSFQSLSGHPGAIDNEGSITASPGGSVTLLGGTVLNSGLVVADYGTVAMGAGQAATLDFYGGGLLRLQVSGDLKTNASGAKAAVENSGSIQANGGQVLLTARATQDVFASAVDNSGVIRAARIKNAGGVIQLLGTDGAASDSGTLDASSTDAPSAGGTVTVTGKEVSLAGTAKVNVSGPAGGGAANIGGGLHGADSSIPNASSTSVDSGATIDADATSSGKGGTIAVWSDGTTTARGSFSANGGSTGGDGGMIETSGDVLDVTGAIVRAAAPAGNAGTWLLDPSDVQIDHAASAGTTLTGGNNGNGTSPVSDADINAALAAGTNVTIQTSSPAPGSLTSTGKISFATGVIITNNGSSELALTLDADTGIDMTGAAVVPSITSGTKPLDLVLNANVNGKATTSSMGSVALDGTINVNSLTITGTGPISQTAGSLITVAGATLLTDTGAGGTSDISLSNATNTFTGDVTLDATNSSVTLANSAAGGMTLTGTNTASSLTLDAGGAVTFGTAGTDSMTVTNGLVIHGLNGSGSAGGAVSQNGTLSVGTTTSIDTGTNDIALSNSANALTGSITLTGGAVTLANSKAITLAGTNSASSLTLDAGGAVAFGSTGTDSATVTNALIVQGLNGSGAAGGAVSQNGTLSVGTTTSIDAGTHNVTLANSGNSFTGALTLTGGAVTLANSLNTTMAGTNGASSLTLDAGGAVAFGTASGDTTTVTGTGALIIQGVGGSGAAGGAVTQLGNLVVGGTSSIDAGTHAITLANTSNSFTGALTLAGGAVTLANSTNTTLAGINSASSLTLDAGGAVAFGTSGADTTTVTGTGALTIQGAGGSGPAGGAV
ncbi:MAG: beta strand repeat-containing protein, partial [Steroidobacteraceae bacterium]